MKAFKFNSVFGDKKHKEDCITLWTYLTDVGSVNFSEIELASFYKEYCLGKHNIAWICTPDADTIEDFALWLADKDI